MRFWSFIAPLLVIAMVLVAVFALLYTVHKDELLFVAASGAVAGAAVGAIVAHYLNWYIVKSTQKWEKHRHVIVSGEKFCDELLERVIRYWRADLPIAILNRHDSIMTKAEISGEISTSVLLITRFAKENFSTHAGIQEKMDKIINITNNNYPMSHPDNLSDYVGPIIDLRFAFSSAKP